MSHNAITRREHDKPSHNMQIVCHIKEEKNANSSNLINIGVSNQLQETQQHG